MKSPFEDRPSGRVIDKASYKAERDRLGVALTRLQRHVVDAQIPVLILVSGMAASGKGDSIARLVEHLDPRGFQVHSHDQFESAGRPRLAQFWEPTPARGDIAILDRSWHDSAVIERVAGWLDDDGFDLYIREICELERELIADGTLIVKLWLDVSRHEVEKRIDSWERDPCQRWRVGEADSETYPYDDLVEIANEVTARTHWEEAPWTVIDADEDRWRRLRVLEAVVDALRQGLESLGLDPDALPPVADEGAHRDPLAGPIELPADSPLARADLHAALSRDAYKVRLDAAQARLRDLHFEAYRREVGTVLVFEGWDAAGKGGAIKRLTRELDPRGYRVVPIAAPVGDEIEHHYLWRFWRAIPPSGRLTIFDRSWYGRVLVERVEGLADERAWRRAYGEIEAFERQIADAGQIILKFWLQISPDEQLRRFRERESTPHKRHKITADDWRNRAKYGDYLEAVDDMLRVTHSRAAPWVIVEAEDKLFARVKVIETVVGHLEATLEHS